MKIKHTIIPHLWFDNNAEEAVNFYVSLFADSKITKVAAYGDAGSWSERQRDVDRLFPQRPGIRRHQWRAAIPAQRRQFAAVWCDNQAEIDELYGKLLAGGGKEQACGWVQDRFGPIWQVNYKRMPEMIGSGEGEAPPA
jgi:predicted 3-demethylubiquinone-9 3-methyltransferase (glyoxalase superfamily)